MILVTGAAGLLGNELIQQLDAKGLTVKAGYHTTFIKNNFSSNIIATSLDILDVYALEAAMEGVSEVYHCAGLVSFSSKDAEKLYKINVEGTANVVNACINANVNKLLHVSSVAALGRMRHGQTINETMQWTEDTSNSKYGHSKYLGELEVWRGVAEGLNAVVINPSIILGAGNWDEGSTKLFKNIFNGFNWYSTGITGFVDVQDVAMAMIALMQSDIAAEKYIVSSENVTYQTVLNIIAEGFNKKLPSKKITKILANIFWRVEAIKSKLTNIMPLVTKETAATSLAEVHFDNAKLLAALPNFTYQKLEDSIKRICRELKEIHR